MAQRDAKSTHKESAAVKERPSSIKFKTSLSQPAQSTLTNEKKPKSRRRVTLPEPLINTYLQSPAERYINSLSQMATNSNEQQDKSPKSPLSTPPSNAETSITTIQSPMSHAERMHKWHQEQVRKIHKKHKYQYIYGPPPSSPTYFSPSAQLNLFLSPQKNNNIQSSMLQTPTIKKDTLNERSKTNESKNFFSCLKNC